MIVTEPVCNLTTFPDVKSPEVDAQVEQMRLQWHNAANTSSFELTVAQAAWFHTLGSSNGDSVVKRQALNANLIPKPKRVRKEYRQMTKVERKNFQDAVTALKKFRPDPAGDSAYDLFVKMHQPISSPAAHDGAAFPPWHREYLLR